MILEVQNGCFGYPKQPVILENINLRLEEGHILATLGPNGIGKTTLLKCMIGLLPWHSGKTLFYGKDIHTLKPKDVWSTISYIPQSRGFAFSYTGLEMVLLGRSAHLGTFQQPGKEEIEMAEAMMERVGITRLANKDCNRMSGGELQMVLIARALINEPKLIILDEPETGLDFHNQILVVRTSSSWVSRATIRVFCWMARWKNFCMMKMAIKSASAVFVPEKYLVQNWPVLAGRQVRSVCVPVRTVP